MQNSLNKKASAIVWVLILIMLLLSGLFIAFIKNIADVSAPKKEPIKYYWER